MFVLFHVRGCCLYKISSDHSMGIQLEVNWGGGTYPEASMEVAGFSIPLDRNWTKEKFPKVSSSNLAVIYVQRSVFCKNRPANV